MTGSNSFVSRVSEVVNLKFKKVILARTNGSNNNFLYYGLGKPSPFLFLLKDYTNKNIYGIIILRGEKMNYIDIYKNDTTNGSGIRVVLWTSGCSHHCPECHNPQTWDETAGKLFDETAEKELFNALSKPYIKGITFSGGDPLYINNLDEVLRLSQKIKEDLPDKDIWLYTGYTYESIINGTTEDMLKRQKILKNVDILVDGPFIINLKDLRLKWRGSSNQRIINVQNSLKENNIVIEEE